MVFLPVVVFFAFHSYFPSKQERFIFTVIPLIVTLSVVGWLEITQTSPFWLRHQKLVRGFWIWFWIMNTVLLVPFTVYYSKRSRVESMYYFYNHKVTAMVLVGGNLGTIQPPLFYSDQYPMKIYPIENDGDLQQLPVHIQESQVQPNYVVMFGKEDIDRRAAKVETTMQKKLVIEKQIDPSFLDDVFYHLNPRGNKNQAAFIYHIAS